MGFGKSISTLMLVLGLAWSTTAANVEIAPDRMLVVDGARTFVIGLYENPAEDAVLDEVAAAGFNLVQAGGDLAALDRLHQHGLYAWINVGGNLDLSADAEGRAAQLAETVTRFGDHPALIVWEGPDEYLWTCTVNAIRGGGGLDAVVRSFTQCAETLIPGIAAGCAEMKRLDPGHPVWLNHAAGNALEYLAGLGRAADIIGADIYPLMPYPTSPIDYSRWGLGWVGSCTTRMQASAPGKPVWMVLQGMSWGSLQNDLFTLRPLPEQYPTHAESRFMAYDAIVRGARAILYWGTPYVSKDSDCWRGILDVVRELAAQKALLAAPDASLAPEIHVRAFGLVPLRMKNPPLSVHALGKDIDGRVSWIVVNEYFFPVACTLRGLEALDGISYADTTTGSRATVHAGALSVSLPAYGVSILNPSDM